MGPIPSQKRGINPYFRHRTLDEIRKEKDSSPTLMLDYKDCNSVAEVAATARRELLSLEQISNYSDGQTHPCSSAGVGVWVGLGGIHVATSKLFF